MRPVGERPVRKKPRSWGRTRSVAASTVIARDTVSRLAQTRSAIVVRDRGRGSNTPPRATRPHRSARCHSTRCTRLAACGHSAIASRASRESERRTERSSNAETSAGNWSASSQKRRSSSASPPGSSTLHRVLTPTLVSGERVDRRSRSPGPSSSTACRSSIISLRASRPRSTRAPVASIPPDPPGDALMPRRVSLRTPALHRPASTNSSGGRPSPRSGSAISTLTRDWPLTQGLPPPPASTFARGLIVSLSRPLDQAPGFRRCAGMNVPLLPDRRLDQPRPRSACENLLPIRPSTPPKADSAAITPG